MTPEELNKIITAVEKTIQEKVNGKIDRQHKILEKQNETMAHFIEKVDAHIHLTNERYEVTEKFIQELLPVRDGLQSIQSINKFVKWLGLPAIGAFIMWFFFTK